MTRPTEPPDIPGVEKLEYVGQGGYGTVWRGFQTKHRREVAVKVLSGRGKRERKAFEAEIRAMGQLSGHPHIVTLYDSGTTRAGEPYLLMEYCPDRSYGAILAERTVRGEAMFTAAEVADVGQKVADALTLAHECGIVHGDVSPDNVLRTPRGQPVLADFGQAVRTADHERPTAGLNLSHVAPEVLSTGRAVRASDVYGLGSTLYTLLAGHPPFGAVAGEDPIRQQQRILTDEPAPLPPEYVPAALADAVSAMLRRDPRERPSARQAQVLLDQPFGDSAVPSSKTVTVWHPDAVREGDEEDPQVEDERPRRWPVAVGIGTGLAVAATLLTLAVRAAGPAPVTPSAAPQVTPSPSSSAPPSSAPVRAAFRLTVRDNGRTAELSWTPYRDADYYLPGRLRTAPRRQPDTLPLVRPPRTSTVVEIDPLAPYCFQVAAFGKAFGDPPRSNVVGIRGATCPAEV